MRTAWLVMPLFALCLSEAQAGDNASRDCTVTTGPGAVFTVTSAKSGNSGIVITLGLSDKVSGVLVTAGTVSPLTGGGAIVLASDGKSVNWEEYWRMFKESLPPSPWGGGEVLDLLRRHPVAALSGLAAAGGALLGGFGLGIWWARRSKQQILDAIAARDKSGIAPDDAATADIRPGDPTDGHAPVGQKDHTMDSAPPSPAPARSAPAEPATSAPAEPATPAPAEPAAATPDLWRRIVEQGYHQMLASPHGRTDFFDAFAGCVLNVVRLGLPVPDSQGVSRDHADLWAFVAAGGWIVVPGPALYRRKGSMATGDFSGAREELGEMYDIVSGDEFAVVTPAVLSTDLTAVEQRGTIEWGG